MTQLRCQDCGDVIDGKRSDIDEVSCECGGDYAVYKSEDDGYEEQSCPHCKKEIKGYNEDGEAKGVVECNECSDEVCEDCIVPDLENVTICKQCIDKAYPRKAETQIEYKEKIVETPVKIFVDKDGTPLDTSFNPLARSKFD